jgi:hypothetical protein
VEFGGDGPTRPLLLRDGVVTRNLGTQEVLLKYENIESSVDPGQRLWVYKIRNHGTTFGKTATVSASSSSCPKTTRR